MKNEFFYIYEQKSGKILYKSQYPKNVKDENFWKHVWDICDNNGYVFEDIDWEIYYSLESLPNESSQ